MATEERLRWCHLLALEDEPGQLETDFRVVDRGRNRGWVDKQVRNGRNIQERRGSRISPMSQAGVQVQLVRLSGEGSANGSGAA